MEITGGINFDLMVTSICLLAIRMETTVMYGGINFDLMVTNICLLAPLMNQQ
jgi:hypothetical protein